MIRRPIELLALSTAGAVLSAEFGSEVWVGAGGAISGAMVWVALDNLRANRVLRWLAGGDWTNPPHVSAVWAEVVERTRRAMKQLDRLARKSDNRLSDFLAAIQASPNGVILIGKDGTIEWSNLTAAQHLGFDAQRDLDQYIRNLVRVPEFIEYLNEGDFGKAVEIDSPRSDPSQPQRISIHIHPYGKGRKLMLTRDITALQMAETMRRDFVANVSHEIRTPLTVLSGFVQTMSSLDLSEDERRRYLALMGQQADRMQSLVDDLLTLSRLEGSPAPNHNEWVAAEELLAQAVEDARSLSRLIAPEGHSIEVEAFEGFDIAVSRSEMLSAMSNLLSNAVRYTPPGGHIRAGWRRLPEGGSEFFVTDTGPGIAPEHLPRLTERFYRVDRSRSRESGGTGLGLAIVKHVAQRHGGSVQVDSALGQGSTFRITLPASRMLLSA